MRKLDTKTIVVASHNAGKIREIEDLIGPFGFSAKSAAELKFEEPDETGTTFEENATIKALASAKASGLPALSDDSGLVIDALGGAPGVYTADWAATPNGRDFTKAMTDTWAKLEAAGAPFPRTAQFRCTLVLAWPDGHDEMFEGVMPGQVVWPMRGDQGHGYDPIFQPDGFDRTFGEMDRWEKNGISHRAKAFRNLMHGCFK